MLPGIQDLKVTWHEQAILSPAEKAQIRFLLEFGAYCRRTGKNLVKSNRRGTAPAGAPPYSHTGILKDFTYFVVDREAKEVVIGPAKTNQVFVNRQGQPVRGTVPEVIEFGGEITILEVLKAGGVWRRADMRSRRRLAASQTRLRTATIEPHPWMRVAFERTKEKKMPAMLADFINKAA